MSKAPFRVPHTLVLLWGLILVALLATWVLPQGEFRREQRRGSDGSTHSVVVPGTYQAVEQPRPGPEMLFTAIPRGLAAAKEIIFFVFLVGGAFAVLRATGSVDALVGWLLKRLGGRPGLLIGGGVVLFAAGSSMIGMAEEYLPFVPVLLILSFGLGFDAVTAVGILCVGYSIGYGTAALNPFTVLVAQDIAGLPPASGLFFRLLLFSLLVPGGILYVLRYARKVRRDPSQSLVADLARDPASTGAPGIALKRRHVLVLACTLAALALLVIGIKAWDWYLDEMGALFLGLALLVSALGRLGPDPAARAFCAGAAEMTTTALLIGFARSIQVVLDQGRVVDTIIEAIATPLQELGPGTGAVGMLLVQTVTNLFICSGSGQAYVTMPIMAPLADLIGVSRQTAVLAFQFGDGFSNVIVPTSPVLMGILAMAGIPYQRWLRFIAPFMALVLVAGALALLVSVWFGYR
jgi:uncharacterized ion transporter superfamily protein YfcC